MIFVSSNSAIEKNIFHRIHLQTTCQHSDIHSWMNSTPEFEHGSSDLKCLVYSFQQLESYKHLDSFEAEIKAVDRLINFIEDHEFEKIILLSYPGAYFNSQNLFLKYKGIIEQKFMNTEIPCTILNVQAIHDDQERINNLQSLFYEPYEDKILIPQKSSCVVYSINTSNLVKLIMKATTTNTLEGKFDAFDTIYELKTFVSLYTSVHEVQRVSPIYLYFKSFIGIYASPTMLELFLMTIVPMYKFRTEKEFGLELDAEKHGIYVTFNKPLVALSSPYNSILKSLISIA